MSGIKKDMGVIQKAVQVLAGTYDKDLLSFEVAKVTAVDTQNWLCTADLVSSTTPNTFTNIQLTSEKASNGFIQVPQVGSNVILAITWRNEVYVAMCSEIDALVFHQVNSDGKTFEEFVINCNSKFNAALPLGIQLIDGGGNGIVITSGKATTTNNNGNNGVVISSGAGKVTNDGNGMVISNSSASVSNNSNNILMSCTGTLKLNSDSFGGMVEVIPLVSAISALQNQFNDLKTLFNTHIHSGGTVMPDAVTGVPATLDSDPVITPTKRGDIENTDVTHGPKVS